MLSKDKRLNLRHDFKWVTSGKRIQTNHLKLMYRFGNNIQPLVGIALSKQQHRKAHDRNRARRLTSKVIEGIYSKLRKDLNLVIMPKSEVLSCPQEVLSDELSHIKDLFKTN